MQDKNLQTTSVAGNDPAGRMFEHKTWQLFDRDGDGWRLRSNDAIYIEICETESYFYNMTPQDQTKCRSEQF